MQYLIILITFLLCSPVFGQLTYPKTSKIPVVDTYFGVTYTDNYRWLEDLKNPKVISWFKNQANLTDSIMNTITGREELINEWRKLVELQPSIYFSQIERGKRIFLQKINRGEKVSKIYFRQSGSDIDQLLFDPMTYISGRTLSVKSIQPSYDGKKLLIAYSEQGGEFSTLIVMDVDRKLLLSDSIPNTFGAGDWSFDNNSFLYSWIRSSDLNDPTALLSSKIKLHVLASPVESDKDFFSDERFPNLKIDEEAYPYVIQSKKNQKYIFAGEYTVQNESKLYYATNENFDTGTIPWKVLCTREDELIGAPAIFKNKVFMLSHKDAPMYKLVSTDLEHPDWDNALVAVAETSKKLEGFIQTKDFIFLTYSEGINNELVKFDPSNNLMETIKLPFQGTIAVSCINDNKNNLLIGITSWNKPYSEFNYDATTGSLSESNFNKPSFFPQQYLDLVVEEVEVKGHDGEKIPMSLIYKKGLAKNGKNVCFMEGYGAYGMSMYPYFSLGKNSLAVKGVVIAIPHVRGGGEKGDGWHKAGFKTTKPNTWKDFISCAEYLIDQGYTSPEKLSASSTSAGGILISRAITERPDLFAAAICNVGSANAMRTEFTSNGPANVPEFGTVKDSIESRALYEMDGMQHVKIGIKYPAVMCVAGWNDFTVAAWETGKFAAALQNDSASERPILMKVNYDNGHSTDDREVSWANFATQYAFAMWQCGHPDFHPK